MGEFSIALAIAGTAVTQVLPGNSQHRGMRPYQEDSFGYSSVSPEDVSKNGFIAVVSDGMGGLSCGDKVSGYAVSRMQSFCGGEPIPAALAGLVNAISAEAAQLFPGGGATLSAVYCARKGVYWCSTGDSRIYLCRNGRLHRLTRDFDYADRLLDRVIDGEISFDDLDGDPKKDTLAEYIGSGEPLSPDVNQKPFLPDPGDKLLICSDGVYNAVSESELLLQLAKKPQECADGILAAVLNKGYENQDNFTSVVLEFM